MNTEKPQSEPCTTKSSADQAAATDLSTDSITDHETKCLRMGSVLHYRGPFRVYFNRKEDAPRLMSIDNGSHAWEVVCKSVKIDGLSWIPH